MVPWGLSCGNFGTIGVRTFVGYKRLPTECCGASFQNIVGYRRVFG